MVKTSLSHGGELSEPAMSAISSASPGNSLFINLFTVIQWHALSKTLFLGFNPDLQRGVDGEFFSQIDRIGYESLP